MSREIPITQGRGGVSVAPRSLAAQLPKPKVPSEDQRAGNYGTKTATFFTKPGVISILHAADSPWVQVTMVLETAGPVAFSTAADFSVTSGTGIQLTTGVERKVTIAKGSRLYITSTTVNRISYIVEPVAWAEQILGGIVNGLSIVGRMLLSLGGKK